jgi:hypothetical protein
MALTMKYYLRALKKIGMQGATDIFQTFKNKYAKVDGVVDPQYRIK